MNRTDLLRQLRQHRPPPPGVLLPSGSPALDILLGGGWTAGSVSELSGPPDITAPLAYRAIAAAQAASPGTAVILAARDFDPRLARLHGADPDRIWVTRPRGPMLELDPGRAAFAVLDRPFDVPVPFRRDGSMTVLALTRYPGYLRSGTCVQAVPEPGTHGTWTSAGLLWQHAVRPARFPGGLPAAVGKDALAQEIVCLAVMLDVMAVRGTWYSYRERRVGQGWKAAVRAIAAIAALREQVLGGIARTAPVHPAWKQAYA